MASATQELRLVSSWSGEMLPPGHHVTVSLGVEAQGLAIVVDAPFCDNPAPTGPAGSIDQLWRFEVVEVFLLGDREHYLEVELGPHGHYWVLELLGQRTVVRHGMALDYRAVVSAGRWRGQARVPLAWLPAGLARVNAFAAHCRAGQRQFLAWRRGEGVRPDFHDLRAYGYLDEVLVAQLSK